MNEDDWKAFFKAVALVGGIFIIIALISNATTPKCIKAGCDKEQASGSSYCYLHKLYSSNSSYKSSTKSYSNSSSSSSTKKSTSTGGSKNYSSNPYKSYDEGYEDVYDHDDYDWDRYYSDDDYADGVDDAMDELDW